MNEHAHLKPRSSRGWPKGLLATGLLALLVACGGGGMDLAGGVGSGGSGVAEGTVSGFGSVIVDGVSYADAHAGVSVENAQGQTESTWAKLGQRVRIRYREPGVADEIRVLPQLRGPAASALDVHGRFTLLGQTVQIVSSSDIRNTATVLAGLNTILAGDEIEVHGTWVFDGSAGVNHYVLHATRVEKLASPSDPVLVSGIVRQIDGNTLLLNDEGGTRLRTDAIPGDVAVGGLVNAWVPRAASAVPGATWAAAHVGSGSPQAASGERLLIGAQLAQIDAQEDEVRVQGLQVKLPPELRDATLTAGAAVQLEIERDGAGWKAVSLKQRANEDDLGGVVELKGTVPWPGGVPAAITVRGNEVQLPTGVLPAACTGWQTNDSVYVEIKARRMVPGQPLQARSIECTGQVPEASVREAKGTLTSVGATSIQVTTPRGVLTLDWSATTLQSPDAATLSNRSVDVEYQWVGGAYRLRKIELKQGSDD